MVKDLGIIDPGTKRYNSLLSKLILELERHVIEEENRVFAGVRKRMSSQQFKALRGRRVQRAA